jgi:DNA-binding XRE family transcriptional regulator
VVAFRGRHRGASAGSNPNNAGSARILIFAKASRKTKNLAGGMRPCARQLDTAEAPTPVSLAAAKVPPMALTASSTVVMRLFRIGIRYNPKFMNMSSIHGKGLDFVPFGRDNLPMPDKTQVIADRLRATREALGLKAVELCRAIDCSPTRWSNYETGRQRITEEIAIRLCDVYGLTLDWIYRGRVDGLPLSLHRKLAA